jgi:hypothetical protein
MTKQLTKALRNSPKWAVCLSKLAHWSRNRVTKHVSGVNLVQTSCSFGLQALNTALSRLWGSTTSGGVIDRGSTIIVGVHCQRLHWSD